MSVTFYSSNRVLDYNFGGTSYSVPSNFYFSLSTTTPDISGSGFTEPSGGSYARTLLANNKTNWGTASNGSLSNLVAVTFPESTASWGTITYVGIFDAASGGNLLWYDALSPARTVASATTVLFAIGSITVQFNNS
jgi:hypothetical protein